MGESRKDYYKILGLSDEDKKLKGEEFEKKLKSVYRKMAVKLHPDKQQGKSEAEKKAAEEKFKEASEAYDVLLNHRDEYDNPKAEFKFDASGFGGMNFDDILRGFDIFGGGVGGMREPRQTNGSSIRITITLTLEEMFSGVSKKIRYKRFEPCEHCGGSGMTEDSRKKTCKTCGGVGMVYNSGGFMRIGRKCPICGGKGYVIENPCPKCNGHGIVQKEFETEIAIGKGVADGMQLVYHGLGNAAPHGNGVNGDLIVLIKQKEHANFERVHNDLQIDLYVNVIDAILGSEVKINTIDGKTLATMVPSGSWDGRKLRFKGYGMPIYGSDSMGDMYVTIRIDIPSEVNDNERRLLEQLRNEEHFKG